MAVLTVLVVLIDPNGHTMSTSQIVYLTYWHRYTAVAGVVDAAVVAVIAADAFCLAF